MAQHQQNEKRPPLDWKVAETFENGDVRAEITTAQLANGKRIYSYGFRRIIRDRDSGHDIGKTTGFFKGAADANSIQDLCDDVKRWIDADREEKSKNRSDHRGRHSHKGAQHAG